MSKKAASSPIEVTCPCCQAKLTVDPELRVVLSHVDPPKGPPRVDLDDTARMLREETERREEKFRQSIEAERNKNEVLDRKFADALKKAKDQPIEKPLRDFELD